MTFVDKLEARAPLAGGILFAIPVLLANYPPMTDLPLHEAVVSVMRHYGDPKFFPDGLYHLNFGHPNQLFYLVAWPLSYLMGTSWALKLVVAATEIALFLSAARLARHVGTPQWTALLVGVLGLGWLFYWGLLANMIGLAAFLAVTPTLDRFVATPTVRGGLISFAALLLLYISHETAMLCACLMMGLFALGYGVLSMRFLARLVPPVCAFSVGAFHLWWAQRMRPPSNQAIPTLWSPLSHKLEVIPGVLFAGYEPYVRHLMFALAMLAMVMFAVERWRERPGLRGVPVRELYVRYRFEIVAACLFLLYLALPYTLSGATLFYHRFFPPAYAILAVVLAPSASAATMSVRSRLPRFAAAVVPLGSIAIAWPNFVESHRLTRDLEALIEKADYNSAVIIVEFGDGPHRLFAQSPLEGHVTSLRGGRSLYDFTRSPIAPAFMNPAYAWDEPYARLMTQPIKMRPEHELDRFRYVYFHSANPDFIELAIAGLQPDAKLIARRGEWALFESTHLKYGLLEPDGKLPYPRPHTLRKRIKDLLRRMNGLPVPPEIVQEPPPGYEGPPLSLPEAEETTPLDPSLEAIGARGAEKR